MLILREFKKSDLTEILGWKLSALDLLHWANIADPNPDLLVKIESWGSDAGTAAFVLESENEVIGYGEIWNEENEAELARLLVRPQSRCKGFGTALLKGLLKRAISIHGKVWIRVHPSNLSAMKLYSRHGFSKASDQKQVLFNRCQPVQYVWMEAEGTTPG